MGWLRNRYGQAIYWSSIGWDVLRREASPSVYVLGYMKTGTNWLCHLLSSALDVPILEGWRRKAPLLGPCVFHVHRIIPLESVRRRTVYIHRDGRDALVSAYFQVVRERTTLRTRFERRLGRPVTAANVRENLAEFIRFMATNRVGTADYRTHVGQWQRYRDQYVTTRYEDLLKDAPGELSRVVERLTVRPADPDRVRLAVERHDFARETGRARGVENPASFLRKGISGDWRNYFTADAARAFDAYAGEVLVTLGYEPDHAWVGRVA